CQLPVQGTVRSKNKPFLTSDSSSSDLSFLGGGFRALRRAAPVPVPGGLGASPAFLSAANLSASYLLNSASISCTSLAFAASALFCSAEDAQSAGNSGS